MSYLILYTHRLQVADNSMSDATIEASEVLHTLMPIERIEQKNVSQDIDDRQIGDESNVDLIIDESQEV